MRSFFALTRIASLVVWVTASPSLANGWESGKGRHELAEAERTLAYFRARPELVRYFHDAFGYAVFPTVGKAALFLGGAYGTGVVFKQGRPIGSARVTKASLGFQIGGEAYSEILFFKSPQALRKFERGELTFHAETSAVAAVAGANLEAPWDDGVAVFAREKGGLMASAAVGGQTFTFEPVGGSVAQ